MNRLTRHLLKMIFLPQRVLERLKHLHPALNFSERNLQGKEALRERISPRLPSLPFPRTETLRSFLGDLKADEAFLVGRLHRTSRNKSISPPPLHLPSPPPLPSVPHLLLKSARVRPLPSTFSPLPSILKKRSSERSPQRRIPPPKQEEDLLSLLLTALRRQFGGA